MISFTEYDVNFDFIKECLGVTNENFKSVNK
jgi:hypothetical protein